MSTIYNIYRTVFINSNKNSKKTIFSKSSNNNINNKNFYFSLFKNISSIKPKSCMEKKKKIKKDNVQKGKIFEKLKLLYSNKTNKRNNKSNNNNNRNHMMWSPINKKKFIRKNLFIFNNSNSNSVRLAKTLIDKKVINKNIKIKNENEILFNYKKENNKLSNLISKQKNKLEKLKTKNKLYKNTLTLLEKENKLLNKSIKNYDNNQEQLILLIKIIQKRGIDIQQVIDEYNNKITNNIVNYNYNTNNKNNNDSISELNIKSESNSFIPITIEKTNPSKMSKIKVPKLNLNKINKK